MSVTTNRVGLPRDAYKGAATTLCAGCGHNSITNHMIKALYELGVEPHLLAKMSGIGCSSKTPAYFVETAHGFNGVHGRMPALTTGAHIANRQLIMLGVSGDGDTASIGLGQFMHMIRRNVDCTYIIEDNGTYGLTKGQFSATADLGSMQKKGAVNTFQPIDPCAVALTLGCSFVARSFSGDGKQVVPLIKAAIAHRGTAILDIISPCVTFNDHDGSTKSYSWVKDHEESIADVSFIPFFEEVHVDYEPGTVREVRLHDGSHIVLKKLGEDHDPTDRRAAARVIEDGHAEGHLVTGLLYVDTKMDDFATTEQIPQRPLKDLGEEELRLSREDFAKLMQEFAYLGKAPSPRMGEGSGVAGSSGIPPRATRHHLTRGTRLVAERDPAMARLIARSGPIDLRDPLDDSFAALVRSIMYQQLAGAAATAIHGRFLKLFADALSPAAVLALPAGAMRSAGVSGPKEAAIADLARKVADGTVPLGDVASLTDDELVARLVQVRGIGRWTAEMFLIFQLRRLDVWPVDDYGVRKGWTLAHRKREMIKPKALQAAGEVFRPYRTIAAWYCWRAVETLVLPG